MRGWRWSSFGAYAGGEVPAWLETVRVLKAFELSEDARGGKAYAGYLEARAKDRKGGITDAALSELRSGWYLGEKSFGEKILEAIKMPFGVERKKGSVGGEMARAHDEAAAERLVSMALSELGLPDDRAELTGRGKWKDETELVAALVRKRTAMPNRWVASRLGMGHEVGVTRAVRRFRDDRNLAKRLYALEKKMED